MLITPQDVKDYTTSSKVKARTDVQLEVDIDRAELKLESMTGRKIDDSIFSPLPTNVKTFLILWAEYYAAASDFESIGMKSETFDDYSYTKDSASTISTPDTYSLIEDYIATGGQIGTEVYMRMRRL